MPASTYMYAAANPPVSARLKSAGGRKGGAVGCEGLGKGRETGDGSVQSRRRGEGSHCGVSRELSKLLLLMFG